MRAGVCPLVDKCRARTPSRPWRSGRASRRASACDTHLASAVSASDVHGATIVRPAEHPADQRVYSADVNGSRAHRRGSAGKTRLIGEPADRTDATRGIEPTAGRAFFDFPKLRHHDAPGADHRVPHTATARAVGDPIDLASGKRDRAVDARKHTDSYASASRGCADVHPHHAPPD